MQDAPIFADKAIGDLLSAHLRMRVIVCELQQLSVRLSAEPLLAAQIEIEARYAAIYRAFAPSETADSPGMLAATVPSLSMTRAWQELSDYALDLARADPTGDRDVPTVLNRLLDAAEKYLPSLSFLITPEEQESASDRTS